jgi:hypothetical protein
MYANCRNAGWNKMSVDADVKDDELYLVLTTSLFESIILFRTIDKMATSVSGCWLYYTPVGARNVGKGRTGASPQFWSFYWRQYMIVGLYQLERG